VKTNFLDAARCLGSNTYKNILYSNDRNLNVTQMSQIKLGLKAQKKLLFYVSLLFVNTPSAGSENRKGGLPVP
jgi:hypothetical protein